jgi:hypothetical protein
MGTGASFVNFTIKKITGFTDFKTRLLDYLKELNRESVQARFDVDGVFGTLHGLSGGVDTVNVTGTSRSTDGQGHTMRVSQALGGTSALFENTNAIVYSVGLRYAEIPTTVSVNPRTGLPEYASFQEEIGEPGIPNAVVNNGSNITFTVDNVCESGVSNAGRTVRVYKLVPAADATADAVAIEDCVVAFTAGANKITTTGLLGQSVVSTTAADYVVVLLGITVKRNTDLEASSNHCFIGTVTGVGAGGTPVTFDTTDQRLLKTFTDSTQVVFTPYEWIAGTTVQDAFEDVVDVLADEGTSNPGAVRIGTNPVGFTPAYPTTFAEGGGGLGTPAEGFFTGDKDLQTILVGIGNAIGRNRAWTRSFGGSRGVTFGTTSSNVLRAHGVGSFVGGTFFLQGTGGYTYTDGNSLANGPYVIGECSGEATGGNRTAIALTSVTDPFERLSGKWQRCSFDQDGSLIGGLDVQGNTVLENVVMAPGILQVGSIASTDLAAFSARQLMVTGATQRDLSGAVSFHPSGSSGIYWSTFDDCYIESPTGALATIWLPIIGTATESNQKYTVFRNCSLRANAAHPVISDSGAAGTSNARFVFDSCSIVGNSSGGVSAAFITMTQTPRLTFRDCTFHDLQAAGFVAEGATFENCRFVIGETSAPTDRILLDLNFCKLRDCVIEIHNVGAGAFSILNFEDCSMNTVEIYFMNIGETLPAARGLNFENCAITNLYIHMNEADMAAGASQEAVCFNGCKGSSINVTDISPGKISGDSSSSPVLILDSTLSEIEVSTGTGIPGSDYKSLLGITSSVCERITMTKSVIGVNYTNAALTIESGSKVNGLIMTGNFKSNVSGLPCVRITDAGCRVNQLECTFTSALHPIDEELISLEGTDNSMTDCKVVAGNRAGNFNGALVNVVGNRNLVTGCHFEWSPVSNVAGQEAVLVSGGNNNVVNNIFVKDLSVAAAGTTNPISDLGSNTIEANNQYRETTL